MNIPQVSGETREPEIPDHIDAMLPKDLALALARSETRVEVLEMALREAYDAMVASGPFDIGQWTKAVDKAADALESKGAEPCRE